MAAVTTPLIQEQATSHRPETVSVVVCANTEERWDDIAGGIRSLSGQTHIPEQVVLVIDYNDDLLEKSANSYASPFGDTGGMRIDVVTNTSDRGLCGARNSGLTWCDGDVVTFLDADTRIGDPRWIATMLGAYIDSSVAGVGGGAIPNWSGLAPPEWFPSEFGWVVGCSYLGLPREPAHVRNFMSCNMSFRREVFEWVGGFPEVTGRADEKPVRCEETEYCVRLQRRFPGARLVFDPGLNVFRRVSPLHRGFKYFRSRCWSEGKSKARIAREVGTRFGLAAEGIYGTKVLPMGVLRGMGEGMRGQLNGFRRAGAIALGAIWTTAGYARGRVGRTTAA